MADLASTDVVVTLEPRYKEFIPGAPVKSVLAQVAFGDGALTYPTNGVPLPAIGNFGFTRGIKAVFIQRPVGLVKYEYDATNHTIRMYNLATDPAAEYTGGTTAVAATTLQLLMFGQ